MKIWILSRAPRQRLRTRSKPVRTYRSTILSFTPLVFLSSPKLRLHRIPYTQSGFVHLGSSLSRSGVLPACLSAYDCHIARLLCATIRVGCTVGRSLYPSPCLRTAPIMQGTGEFVVVGTPGLVYALTRWTRPHPSKLCRTHSVQFTGKNASW